MGLQELLKINLAHHFIISHNKKTTVKLGCPRQLLNKLPLLIYYQIG